MCNYNLYHFRSRSNFSTQRISREILLKCNSLKSECDRNIIIYGHLLLENLKNSFELIFFKPLSSEMSKVVFLCQNSNKLLFLFYCVKDLGFENDFVLHLFFSILLTARLHFCLFAPLYGVKSSRD